MSIFDAYYNNLIFTFGRKAEMLIQVPQRSECIFWSEVSHFAQESPKLMSLVTCPPVRRRVFESTGDCVLDGAGGRDLTLFQPSKKRHHGHSGERSAVL